MPTSTRRKKGRSWDASAPLAAAALAAVLLACASGAPEPPGQVLDTRVRARQIEVDGRRTDWEGNLTRVGESHVFAGFHREGGSLYVALVSQDGAFDARVFSSGLTVWFDTTATRRRTFGVRHPVFGPEARKRLEADSAAGRPDRQRLLEAAGDEVVLARSASPGDSAREIRLSPGEAGGLEVASSIDRGLFTWELRLPLGADGESPGALPVAGSDTISVGLLAGGDQGPSSPEGVPPMEVWVRVNLAGAGGAGRAAAGDVPVAPPFRPNVFPTRTVP